MNVLSSINDTDDLGGWDFGTIKASPKPQLAAASSQIHYSHFPSPSAISNMADLANALPPAHPLSVNSPSRNTDPESSRSITAVS